MNDVDGLEYHIMDGRCWMICKKWKNTSGDVKKYRFAVECHPDGFDADGLGVASREPLSALAKSNKI